MTSAFAATALERLSEAFADASDPEAAVEMRSYMRDQFEFVGIKTPTRTVLARAAFAGLGRPTADDLLAFAQAAWERPERDFQYVATKALRRDVRVLPPSAIGDLRTLIVTKAWWDTVDELARNVVGPLVLAHPELVAVMDRWIDDDDLWLARTAILHQGTYKERTDPERLFRYCLRRSSDTDFFIRKAIGWALRDYARIDEDAVVRFVDDHGSELSGLSRREALKHVDRAREP